MFATIRVEDLNHGYRLHEPEFGRLYPTIRTEPDLTVMVRQYVA